MRLTSFPNKKMMQSSPNWLNIARYEGQEQPKSVTDGNATVK